MNANCYAGDVNVDSNDKMMLVMHVDDFDAVNDFDGVDDVDGGAAVMDMVNYVDDVDNAIENVDNDINDTEQFQKRMFHKKLEKLSFVCWMFLNTVEKVINFWSCMSVAIPRMTAPGHVFRSTNNCLSQVWETRVVVKLFVKDTEVTLKCIELTRYNLVDVCC